MSDRPRVLALGSNRSELEHMAHIMQQEGYDYRLAGTLPELDRALLRDEALALAVVDISGFDESVWRRCEKLYRSNVPVLILSPQRSLAVQSDGLRCANGVLVKPVGETQLREVMRSMLVG